MVSLAEARIVLKIITSLVINEETEESQTRHKEKIFTILESLFKRDDLAKVCECEIDLFFALKDEHPSKMFEVLVNCAEHKFPHKLLFEC